MLFTLVASKAITSRFLIHSNFGRKPITISIPTVRFFEFFGSQIRKGVGDGLVDGVRTVAVEAGVDFFEAAYEVEDLVSRIGASGGGAEMRAATKRAGFVDQAAGGFGIEQRAGAIGGGGQGFASGGAEGFGGDESLASRELGDFSGEMELAAFGAKRAIPLQWPRGEVGVDLLNLGGGFDFQTGEGIGRGHGLW